MRVSKVVVVLYGSSWGKGVEREVTYKSIILDLCTYQYYTRFQCYVHRRHLDSSFDMPSFGMQCKLTAV